MSLLYACTIAFNGFAMQEAYGKLRVAQRGVLCFSVLAQHLL
jgi:hypothetical protein